MCIRGWPSRRTSTIQHIDKDPKISCTDVQSSVLMRTWRKKASTNGSDQGSRTHVHDRVRISFVSGIYTSVRFRPASAESRIEAKDPKLPTRASKRFEGMGSEDSHIFPSDWLHWLNQNHSLVDSDPTNLANLLRLTTSPQLRPVASFITTLRVILAHLSFPCWRASIPSSSFGTDSILDSRPTPRKPL